MRKIEKEDQNEEKKEERNRIEKDLHKKVRK